MFYGSNVALVTPFAGDSIDEQALARLVRFHLDNGTHGIVTVGTTGEAPTLSGDEQRRVTEIVVNEVGGQVPVIAGAGSNDPALAISHGANAASAGADCVLHVMGYYNRPGQEGIFQHFKALDARAQLPIMVYNVPPRTIIDILPETMARLAELPSVIGVKDATRDLARPLLERRLIGDDFCLLSGEDMTAVAYNANGGQGSISVTANVAPKLCAELQQACANGQYRQALDIQMRLMPLNQALFLEPSPAGVKYACSLLGLAGEHCRLPMVGLTDGTRRAIREAMRAIDLID